MLTLQPNWDRSLHHHFRGPHDRVLHSVRQRSACEAAQSGRGLWEDDFLPRGHGHAHAADGPRRELKYAFLVHKVRQRHSLRFPSPDG